MHNDAYIGGHSENNIKCVVHDDLGCKNQTTRYILPRRWLYEWFSWLHSCRTYSVLSRSHSITFQHQHIVNIRKTFGTQKKVTDEAELNLMLLQKCYRVVTQTLNNMACNNTQDYCSQHSAFSWLERLLWGSLTMEKGSSPQSPGRKVFAIFLVQCIVSLFCDVVFLPLPAQHDIFHTTMAQYGLFVLKVLLLTYILTYLLKYRVTNFQPSQRYIQDKSAYLTLSGETWSAVLTWESLFTKRLRVHLQTTKIDLMGCMQLQAIVYPPLVYSIQITEPVPVHYYYYYYKK